MSNNYTIIVTTDGKETWRKTYDNCIDAVESFNKFVDHGFAREELVVILVEPSGITHHKLFPIPVR